MEATGNLVAVGRREGILRGTGSDGAFHREDVARRDHGAGKVVEQETERRARCLVQRAHS